MGSRAGFPLGPWVTVTDGASKQSRAVDLLQLPASDTNPFGAGSDKCPTQFKHREVNSSRQPQLGWFNPAPPGSCPFLYKIFDAVRASSWGSVMARGGAMLHR